jgi:hypothetical protein
LLEASWFILINSVGTSGARLVKSAKAEAEGTAFLKSLIRKLHQRELAIPLHAVAGPLSYVFCIVISTTVNFMMT